MSQHPRVPNLGTYLTVRAAAEFLGVSPATLRNWDRDGKLKPFRHPLNGYRLYRRLELQDLLARITRPDGSEP